jgi:hypothetical protein
MNRPRYPTRDAATHAACGIAVAFIALAVLSAPAHADGCAKTRDYILRSGQLPQRAENYKDLFKMCLEALLLPTVKDAFILREGAVAIVPRTDRIALTATTLAQFCARFPRGTLHFVTRQELARAANTAQAVRIPRGTSTPCQKISGR